MSKAKKINKYQKGFTLIEMMISMTIFSVIVVVGLEAVLSSVDQHTRSQDMRSVMDNLNFSLEDMSRNIRLGTNFHCMNPGESSVSGTPVPQDCSGGSNQIVFTGVTGPNITYTISPPSSGVVQVTKQIGAGSIQVFTLPEVTLDYYKSGFVVVGAPVGDGLQPVVNIGLSGKVTYKGTDSSFSIQTTVASRPLDG
jgi:prepilin-type N-terminal cleavage/methylation domain-containing protein